MMLRNTLRVMGLLAMVGCHLSAWASTTSGTTARALNMADGIVTMGALPGTNGSDWEADEVYEGFSGAVNWYLTWDDTNLYLGRVGGNNAEGAVIYIHANYPGAVFSDRGYQFDGLQPQAAAMGGVNFAGYIRSGWNEYRTFDGPLWSNATANTLNPHFSSQGNGANMEVVIPWSAVTGNHGVPSDLRLVQYMVVPAGLACAQEFVYGEAPWGTGNLNDGPAVGVNDGVGISLRQPGGCGVGSDTLRRWWGCYPVIGGISGNAWTFQHDYVSLDTLLCLGQPFYDLVGHGGVGTGSWSILQQPAGSNVVLNSTTAAAVQASSLHLPGAYTFVFATMGSCEAIHDTVRYHLVAPGSIDIGPDASICPGDTACFTAVSSSTLSNLLWTNGQVTSTACFTQGGIYACEAADGNGCILHDTAMVSLLPTPSNISVSIDTMTCPVLVFTATSTGGNAYTWHLGSGVQLSGASVSYDYSAWGLGNYPFSLDISNGTCTTTTLGTAIVSCFVGIAQTSPCEFKHSPNPTSGIVHVQLGPSGPGLRRIDVMDFWGRRIANFEANGKLHEIDFSQWPTGIYDVRITLSDGRQIGFMQWVQ